MAQHAHASHEAGQKAQGNHDPTTDARPDGCFLLMKGWIYKHFSPHETNGWFRKYLNGNIIEDT